MASTPKYGLPTPDLPDAPNIPYDMYALALATENIIDAASPLDARYIVGNTVCVNLGPGPTSQNGPLITFPVGKFTTTPSITATLKVTGVSAFPVIATASAGSFQTILTTPASGTATSVVQSWQAWSMDLSPHTVGVETLSAPDAYTATCVTAGCHNENQPVDVPAAALGGGLPDVVCGACGNPVPGVVAL